MVKQLRPVLSVGGGAEDVHHHEVLDVVLLSPRLLQLVDVIPAMQNIEYDIQQCQTVSHVVTPADSLHLPDHGDVHVHLLLPSGPGSGGCQSPQPRLTHKSGHTRDSHSNHWSRWQNKRNI